MNEFKLINLIKSQLNKIEEAKLIPESIFLCDKSSAKLKQELEVMTDTKLNTDSIQSFKGLPVNYWSPDNVHLSDTTFWIRLKGY